jgi:uncharacterized protein (TIGR03086 family)
LNVLDLHLSARREFDTRLRAVPATAWSTATPCDAWTVRDLVNHVVAEQLWVPRLLQGATPAEVGDALDGDRLGADPVAAWAEASAAARDALTGPEALARTVVISAGTIPAEMYAWQLTSDLAIHAWDLAVAVGLPAELDPTLVGALLAALTPFAAGLAASGRYAPPVPVAEDSPPQTRLLALTGRAVVRS